jgi:AcrR family transcriptional regulator
MSPTRRERLREATLAEIKATAWQQIAAQGAPALSLRAIARQIGMTAPGLYRYFPSRDDLVTALIIDAFDLFAQSLEAARDALPAADHAGRCRAVCLAYFQWAVAYPERYTLIFGAPVPGYQMQAAAYPAAQRGFLALQTVIGEAFLAGQINPDSALRHLQPALLARYETLSTFGMPYPPQVTHLALKTWSEMHGVTSLYLSGYLSGFLAEQVQTFVRQTVDGLVELLGLPQA